MDLLGGHAAEESVSMHRHNDTTGARFVWEQEGFNPVTRHIHCYITLRDPDTQKVLTASLDDMTEENPSARSAFCILLPRPRGCHPAELESN